jgi:hypothetical protein
MTISMQFHTGEYEFTIQGNIEDERNTRFFEVPTTT